MTAVESTIGPKGLDTMLVDQFGNVVITNDGVTILNMMEVNHPVARMLIHSINAQQEEVGDGTTTAALMAGEMVVHGLEQVTKGVPVAQVLTGLRYGVKEACRLMEKEAVLVGSLDTGQLYNIAYVAGREDTSIAKLIMEGAALIGQEKLLDTGFRFSQRVQAVEGADSEVVNGVFVTKERLTRQMPLSLEGNLKIMVLDDALEPEELNHSAMATESGFQQYLILKEQFKTNIQKLIETGVQAVFVDRGADDAAVELLEEAGVLVVARLPHKELVDLAEHCGAKLLKRSSLQKPAEELEKYFGSAQSIIGNEKLHHIKVLGGGGKAMATILVGATTGEVVGEKERIAKDAAASVQSALQRGLVSGGGAAELAVARQLEQSKNALSGMAVFGADCVIAALKKPFMHIVANAGFNPLEKLGDVHKAQELQQNSHLSINCDTGRIDDMYIAGVVDPLYVKLHGLKTAGEVAEAILRINIIVKKKEYQQT
ncbi:MAG: TCP-1/cpn60 chaperonin family protein, partial [Peptococcaceae bacterium]|nr:TCP-1/cpn60 chaperonin family protein [Peptococcaceae bacterium]